MNNYSIKLFRIQSIKIVQCQILKKFYKIYFPPFFSTKLSINQTCPLITKNRSIARSLIIPKKWSIARSLITEIEVINRSLNSITFRSKHLKNFSLFLYYCPDCPLQLECLHKTKWIAVNYLFDVFVGLSIQQRQHSPFNF